MESVNQLVDDLRGAEPPNGKGWVAYVGAVRLPCLKLKTAIASGVQKGAQWMEGQMTDVI
ncbi:hypothetical protein ASG92_24025 [Arthrobacter sp. Soil736]|nr:hypothetical protein ASG92_24025 [Arthrobacter sp. Soil736]